MRASLLSSIPIFLTVESSKKTDTSTYCSAPTGDYRTRLRTCRSTTKRPAKTSTCRSTTDGTRRLVRLVRVGRGRLGTRIAVDRSQVGVKLLLRVRLFLLELLVAEVEPLLFLSLQNITHTEEGLQVRIVRLRRLGSKEVGLHLPATLLLVVLVVDRQGSFSEVPPKPFLMRSTAVVVPGELGINFGGHVS